MNIDTTPGSDSSSFDWFELFCNFAQICAVPIVVEANAT